VTRPQQLELLARQPVVLPHALHHRRKPQQLRHRLHQAFLSIQQQLLARANICCPPVQPCSPPVPHQSRKAEGGSLCHGVGAEAPEVRPCPRSAAAGENPAAQCRAPPDRSRAATQGPAAPLGQIEEV
jgi:hypothetical protein